MCRKILKRRLQDAMTAEILISGPYQILLMKGVIGAYLGVKN